MLKVVFLVHKRADMDAQEFRRHYPRIRISSGSSNGILRNSYLY
jgi:hypothetical protein